MPQRPRRRIATPHASAVRLCEDASSPAISCDIRVHFAAAAAAAAAASSARSYNPPPQPHLPLPISHVRGRGWIMRLLGGAYKRGACAGWAPWKTQSFGCVKTCLPKPPTQHRLPARTPTLRFDVYPVGDPKSLPHSLSLSLSQPPTLPAATQTLFSPLRGPRPCMLRCPSSPASLTPMSSHARQRRRSSSGTRRSGSANSSARRPCCYKEMVGWGEAVGDAGMDKFLLWVDSFPAQTAILAGQIAWFAGVDAAPTKAADPNAVDTPLQRTVTLLTGLADRVLFDLAPSTSS